jgi:MFS family permease
LLPLLLALLGVSFTQQLLVPVLNPLSHDLGLPMYQLSLVITVGSIALTLASPLWGWAVDAAGPRTAVLAGLGLCVLGLAGFAAAVTFGLDETLTPDRTFTLVLVFRSVLLGAGLAVLPVAALAAAGIATATEGERTSAAGLIWAAQGLWALIGPSVGGLLAAISLMVPLYLAPVLTVLIAIVVLFAVKPVARPQQEIQTQPWGLLPAFGVGFLMFLSFGLSQVIVMLLAKEQQQFSTSVPAIGGVLTVSALALVVTQGVAVPLLKWPAARLMRTGAPIALAGYAVLAVASSLWLVVVAYLLVAVGLGLAVTGFAAAASLGVGPRRQGLVAGFVHATNGLALIIGPTLSSLLYDVTPIAPVIAAGAAAALATVLSLSLAQAGPRVPQSVT